MFQDLESFNYVPHVLGFSRVLDHCSAEMLNSEPVREVIAGICLDESVFSADCDQVTESLLSGRDSALAEPLARQSLIIDLKPFGGALCLVQKFLSQLPHLCKLRRIAEDNTVDTPAYDEAVNLAVKLHAERIQPAVENSLDKSVQTIVDDRILDRNQWPLPEAFSFGSEHAFILGITYWHHRNLLCGLLRAPVLVNRMSSIVDPYEVWNENTHAATSLAQCIKHAMLPGNSPPLAALQLIIPLEWTYGTWHIMAERQATGWEREHPNGEKMKNFVLQTIGHFYRLWDIQRIPSPCRLLSISNAVTGGPLMPWMPLRSRTEFDAGIKRHEQPLA